MLSIIPISIRVISKLDPPYDRKGRVTPVTGISPITTHKFKIVWKESINVIPKDKYFPNRSSHFIAIFMASYIIKQNNDDTNSTPKKPNSSLIIEKMKSVWGSGR